MILKVETREMNVYTKFDDFYAMENLAKIIMEYGKFAFDVVYTLIDAFDDEYIDAKIKDSICMKNVDNIGFLLASQLDLNHLTSKRNTYLSENGKRSISNIILTKDMIEDMGFDRYFDSLDGFDEIIGRFEILEDREVLFIVDLINDKSISEIVKLTLNYSNPIGDYMYNYMKNSPNF